MSSILQQVRPQDATATAVLPNPLAIAADLAERLAATVVERDRAGGHPKHERELIRASTLHDPVAYELRDLGRHALSGRVPEPTPYS